MRSGRENDGDRCRGQEEVSFLKYRGEETIDCAFTQPSRHSRRSRAPIEKYDVKELWRTDDYIAGDI
jgi:hypothetical protein